MLTVFVNVRSSGLSTTVMRPVIIVIIIISIIIIIRSGRGIRL